MNKQQLAQKIWASANQMRSKIEASEYKDFILGFIFYKYLSDKEIEFLKANDYDDELLTTVSEDDEETVKWVQQNIGYFIAYSDLFTTWLGMGKDFDVSNVRDALSAFNRLISPTHKRVFEKIFNTLETGLSKLGDSSGTQTKAISGLLNLIKDIPMDGRQGYDVLGFIYEYLISMFAANAGKKAGEFYTPHEVSLLMSEIVANHLRGRTEIKIFEKTLSTLIQTNDTYESTQIDAFFESKPKIDAFLKIDANAQKVGIQNGILTPDVLETGCRFYVCGIFLVCFLYCVLRTSEKRAVSSFPLSCMPRLIHSSIHP